MIRRSSVSSAASFSSRFSPSGMALPITLALLAASAVGCAADTNGTDSTEEDQTGSLVKAGTYKLSGSAQAWTVKDLVLKSDGTYTVVMYPGRAFPIGDVKTTTGKWTASGNTLTIKFAKGNVFEKWSVTQSGSKLHFSDQVESSEFDMAYTGSGQVDPVEPVQGKDPGLPTAVAGGIDIRCHSLYGDVYANLSVARSGVGNMKLSSAKTLALSKTESIKLVKNPDSAGSSGWLSVTGNGNAADGKRYVWALPTSFLSSGGKDKDISMTVGSQDQNNALEVDHGMVCTRF